MPTGPSETVSATERDAIRQVINGYYDTFPKDPVAAAAFYGEPAMIITLDQLIPLNNRAEVAATFINMRNNLTGSGYKESKLLTPHIKFLNASTVLYSGVIVRLREDGSEMSRGGITYLLHKGDAGWKIHELIVTDPDRLIRDDSPPLRGA
jgi:hypothetical protein